MTNYKNSQKSSNDELPNTTLVLTMHDEINESIRCISSYIHNFKNLNIILQGDLYAEREIVAKHFGIHSFESPKTVSNLHVIEGKKFNVPDIEIASITINLFKSILNCCKMSETRYILFLHPDHFIRKNYSKKMNEFSIEIAKTNLYPENYLNDFKVVTNSSTSLKYFGLASYFKREDLITVLDNLNSENYLLIHKLIAVNKNFVYDDSLMPLLFKFMGFTVGYQYITIEAGRRNRITNFFKPHELIHQMPKVKNSRY